MNLPADADSLVRLAANYVDAVDACAAALSLLTNPAAADTDAAPVIERLSNVISAAHTFVTKGAS